MFDSQFVQNTLTPILAIIGACTGITGTVLGIWNWWLNRKSHKLDIRVVVERGGEDELVKTAEGDKLIPRRRDLNIRVINHSYFPVTFSEVGVVMKKSFFSRRNYYPLRFKPSNEKAEKRIDARHSEVFTFSVGRKSEKDNTLIYQLVNASDFPNLDCAVGAYTVLATSHRFKGGRRQIRQVVAEMKMCVEANRNQ